MTIRPLKPEDIPALKAMAEVAGYPYPEVTDPHVEAVFVVVDDQDKPLMAVAAKRILEAYLWCGSCMAPHEKIAALRLMQESMGELLKSKGYNGGCEAFLPPNVSGKFGKRLERTFGWFKNWQSWHIDWRS